MSEPFFLGIDPAPTLRVIADLALAEGDTDLAWTHAFLGARDDLRIGARFDDEELARAPAAENVRVGLRKLAALGILEVRIEREGRPDMAWSVFVPEA